MIQNLNYNQYKFMNIEKLNQVNNISVQVESIVNTNDNKFESSTGTCSSD